MKVDMAKKFRDRGILGPGSRVYAQVQSRGFGGERIEIMKELSVISLNEYGGIGHFVRDHRENFTFNYDTIEEIDSMTPERLAKAYKIK
jgi:hypothetical protein